MQLIIQTFVQFDLIQNLTSRFDESKLCFNCRIFWPSIPFPASFQSFKYSMLKHVLAYSL